MIAQTLKVHNVTVRNEVADAVYTYNMYNNIMLINYRLLLVFLLSIVGKDRVISAFL